MLNPLSYAEAQGAVETHKGNRDRVKRWAGQRHLLAKHRRDMKRQGHMELTLTTQAYSNKYFIKRDHSFLTSVLLVLFVDVILILNSNSSISRPQVFSSIVFSLIKSFSNAVNKSRGLSETQ